MAEAGQQLLDSSCCHEDCLAGRASSCHIAQDLSSTFGKGTAAEAMLKDDLLVVDRT